MELDKSHSFIIEQLEEALEERQNPDRRKVNLGYKAYANEERRKGDRRSRSTTKH